MFSTEQLPANRACQSLLDRFSALERQVLREVRHDRFDIHIAMSAGHFKIFMRKSVVSEQFVKGRGRTSMKVVVSSDERTHLVDVVLEELEKRSHEVIYLGPAPGQEKDWPDVTATAANRVANGEADEAIVMCWTGTGASIAANKVKGIRAALCHDAETAKGARIWNHANVLALSLRATSDAVAKEILEAWYATPYSEDQWNLDQMKRIQQIEDGSA